MQNMLERIYISSGLAMPQDPPGDAGKHFRGEGCLNYFRWLNATTAWIVISGGGKDKDFI